MLLQQASDCRRRHASLQLADRLASHVEHDSGKYQHTVLERLLLIVVDVDLDDLQVLALTAELIEHRSNGATRSTPRCPEIDEHRLVRLKDLRHEGRARNPCCTRHAALLPPHPARLILPTR